MTLPTDVELAKLCSNLRNYNPAGDLYCRYFKEFFPKIKEYFIRNSHDQIPGEEDRPKILISLLGFSPPPVALCIAALNPQKLYFIYLDDSQAKAYRSKIIVELSKIGICPQIEDGDQDGLQKPLSLEDISDPVKVYQRILDIIKEEVKKAGISPSSQESITKWVKENIAVDISGGKKTMTSGAFMAAAMEGINIFYVDNEKFDPITNQPVHGTEILKEMANPYHVFSKELQIKAEKLFDTHHYAEAEKMYEEALNDSKKDDVKGYFSNDNDFIPDIEFRKNWAGIYSQWENMEYDKAYNLLPQNDINSKYRHALEALRLLDTELDKITEGNKYKKALKKLFYNDIQNDDKFIAYFLADYLNRALRNKAQGKYDECLIRLLYIFDFGMTYLIYKRGKDNLTYKNTDEFKNLCGGGMDFKDKKEAIEDLYKTEINQDVLNSWERLNWMRNRLSITHSIKRGIEERDNIDTYLKQTDDFLDWMETQCKIKTSIRTAIVDTKFQTFKQLTQKG